MGSIGAKEKIKNVWRQRKHGMSAPFLQRKKDRGKQLKVNSERARIERELVKEGERAKSEGKEESETNSHAAPATHAACRPFLPSHLINRPRTLLPCTDR